MLQPASCAPNTADQGRDADMQVMFGDVVQYSEKALTSVFPFRECLIESMKRRHLKFRCLTGTQCSGADCVLIFLGAAPCTAPKFYIFTKANMCVNCSVQCAAQRRHQTISLWAIARHKADLSCRREEDADADVSIKRKEKESFSQSVLLSKK